MTEPEIVANLFRLYQELVKSGRNFVSSMRSPVESGMTVKSARPQFSPLRE